MTPDLSDLLGEPRRRREPEIAKARQAEMMRRRSEAHRRATLALTRLHPEDYAALMEQAREQVDAERGALPS